MPTFDEKRNELYAHLMDEVKVRFDCINRAGLGLLGLPAPIVRELCWLQARMICELVALSCLVAHGDLASLKSHKLGRSWSADDIMDRLTKLRPHFYPIAITQTLANSGAPHEKRRYQIAGVEPSPLPKEEFLAFYGRTHRHLHRGSLKNLMSMAAPIDMDVNFPSIVSQTQRIGNLLNNHAIAISEEKLLLCMLANAENNNRVQVAVAEGPLAAVILNGRSP